MSVGFLFTDIDGSTQRWEKAPWQMRRALARHDEILDTAIARHGGRVKDRAGDGVYAVFEEGNPLACALDIQRAMQAENWDYVGGLSLRVGVHALKARLGEAIERANANRAARIMATGWGGQIVVSGEAANLFALPEAASLEDLGLCRLKGVEAPLRLHGLLHASLARQSFPPLRSLAVTHDTIPSPSTPIFGREDDFHRLDAMLGDASARLITILAPAGGGKSRFLIEAARRRASQELVYYVSPGAAGGGEGFVMALAATLRFPLQGGDDPHVQVLRYLRERALLLAVDGFEEPDSDLLQSLLSTCPAVRIMYAKRTPLHAPGERLLRLEGLPCESGAIDVVRASPAYALFAHDRARLGGGVELTAAEAEAFYAICQRLGGSPLALQCTAGWARALDLTTIRERLSSGVAFLADGRVGRGSILREALDGAWAGLSASEKAALGAVAVFERPFRMADAQSALSVDAATLLGLEDAGLLERRDGERFTLHALVRDFAKQQLVQDPPREAKLREAHATWFLNRLRDQPTQTDALNYLSAELADLRQAWEFARCHMEEDDAQTIGERLFYLLSLRSYYHEAQEFFAGSGAPGPLQCLLEALHANCLVQQMQLTRAEAIAAPLLQSAWPRARGHAHQALGNLAHIRGRYEEARTNYLAALAIRESANDLVGVHYSALSLAALNLVQGHAGETREWIKRSYVICRDLGFTGGLLHGRIIAGDLARQEGRAEDARVNYEAALDLEEAVGCPRLRATVLVKLGAELLRLGEHEASIARQNQALELASEVGDERLKIAALLELGHAAAAVESFDVAKGNLLLAVRCALRLGARPLLERGLLDLARVELKLGNEHNARQLAVVLARSTDAQVESLEHLLDAHLACRTASASLAAEDLQAAAKRTLMEADLAALRLD